MSEFGQVSDRSSGASSSYTPPNCARFTGTADPGIGTRHYNLGEWCPSGELLGNAFYIDKVASPGGDGYGLTNGGGQHQPLIGWAGIGGTSPLQYGQIASNFRSDSTVGPGTFSASEGPQLNEIGHFAYMGWVDGGGAAYHGLVWDGLLAYTIKFAAAGSGLQRMWPTAGGTNIRYFGHAGHQGGIEDVFWLRIWDRFNPVGGPNVFFPPREAGVVHEVNTASPADALYRCDRRYGEVLPDLGVGALYSTASGVRRTHTGTPENGNVYGGVMPLAVTRSDCPIGIDGDGTNLYGWTPTRPATPAGVWLWDPVCISPRGYFWHRYSGPPPWQSESVAQVQQTATQTLLDGAIISTQKIVSGRLFGARNGMIRCWYEGNCALLYDAASINREIRFARFQAAGCHSHTGVLFRGNSAGTQYLGVWVPSNLDPTVNNATLYMVDARGGGNTLGFGTGFTPSNTAWTYCRIVPNGTSISIQVNNNAGAITAADGSKWEQVGTYTDSIHGAAGRTLAGPMKRTDAASGNSAWNVMDFRLY